MDKRLIYLIGILLTIVVGTYFSWVLCCPSVGAEKVIVPDASESTVTKVYKSPTLYPFSIKDNEGSFSAMVNDNFNFEDSNLNFLTPVTPSLDLELEKLKNYLNSNDKKAIAITGYYTGEEKNNSAFPNLGLARANSVKNYFTIKGIPSKVINTYGELKKDMIRDSLKVYHGPLSFAILKLEDDTQNVEQLGAHIKEKPIVLHFKSGQATIDLTPEERQEVADISKYLDKVDGAMCIITGHTDKTGNAANNIVLGQNRADFVKQYLINNAIPAAKIIATSKGQKEPIADNKTVAGRAKNRRTVITVK